MIDFKKILNNKTVKIAAIIVVPTAIIGAYLGYKYIVKKIDENRMKKMIEAVAVDNGESIVPKEQEPVKAEEKVDINLNGKK